MKRLSRLKLETKILSMLALAMIIIIALYTFVFTKHYKRYAENLISVENINTLYSLDISMTQIIENTNNYSKMILSDATVQEAMESGDILDDIVLQQEVRRKVYSVLQFAESVEAVWLIDSKGQKLTIGEDAGIYTVETESDHEYDVLKRSYGSAEIIYTGENGKSRMSLVRSFNSLKDFRTLGIIGVDIKQDALDHVFATSINTTDDRLVIVDGMNRPIFLGGRIENEDNFLKNSLEDLEKSDGKFFKKVNINNRSFFVSGIVNENDRWKIVRSTPFFEDKDINHLIQFNIFLIVILGIVVVLASQLISGLLTKPIKTLLKALRMVEEGNLTRIGENAILTEFQNLFKGFNLMVDRIEELIKETIDRQRRIRQVELNEIQEQMKPHFLYNTLESVEALALMGDTDKVCKVIEALGDFYRKSVSGGKEYLSIEEELKIVRDYAQIMEIRFGDSFKIDIINNSGGVNLDIPKLTIQPLVENAFQHGVRAKNNFGLVKVLVECRDNILHVMVADSGDGVSDSVIDEIAGSTEPMLGKSLGLRGTVERLRLMYGEHFSYKIYNKNALPEDETPSQVHLYIEHDLPIFRAAKS